MTGRVCTTPSESQVHIVGSLSDKNSVDFGVSHLKCNFFISEKNPELMKYSQWMVKYFKNYNYIKLFCITWLHLFQRMLCCSLVATPWHAYVPSWQVILSYTAWICATAIVSVTVNSADFSHGKVNRFSFCHIPFHSEGNFWQGCCCPARWLKGSFGSVSAVDLSTRLAHTHTRLHTCIKKKNTYSHYVKLLCTVYVETYSLFLVQKNILFRTSNTWKTIVWCLKNGSSSLCGQ